MQSEVSRHRILLLPRGLNERPNRWAWFGSTSKVRLATSNTQYLRERGNYAESVWLLLIVLLLVQNTNLHLWVTVSLDTVHERSYDGVKFAGQ